MKHLVIAVAVLGICVAGCKMRANRVYPKAADPQPSASAATGEWTLTQLGLRAPNPSAQPWIRIEENGSLSGWAGVNQISTRLDRDGLSRGAFKAEAIIATRMAGPPEAMQTETEFLKALKDAATFTVRNDGLDLWNSSGQVVASFSHRKGR